MILINDFKAEPADLRQAMLAATERVIASGWYILGQECKNFEAAFAQACDLPHAIGVGNGMDAIEIILRGLDIGPGDEVITTPMTAFATVLAILRAGAEPVLADIDPDTGLLSLDSVRRCMSPRVKAVVLVHLYGQVRAMTDWVAFARETGIHLVEDCAQSHLATWRGTVCGGFGIAGAFSFYPTKNLGALGDGGLIATADGPLAERAGRLRNYGQSERYHHPDIGLNSRLDELQAAILSVRLAWLERFTARRRQIAAAYQERLKDTKVRLLAAPDEPSAHVHHLYVLCSQDRERLSVHLAQRGVQSLIHYPVPVHQQPPCRDLRRDPRGLPAAERHAATCLSIPCHPQMSDDDIDTVVAAVAAFEPR